jgi:L-lactate dehydrogenase complex protein LldE
MAEPFRVALFVTCLVDLFRPSVGFAAVKLLEDAGCVVDVPAAQSCCGQPGYNSGDRGDAQAIARQVIANFSGYDYVVVPSGSCGGMIKTHYPTLFPDDPAMTAQATALAARTYELISFLADVLKRDQVDARYAGTVTYHDACSGLRELGVKDQPRRLLQSVDGLSLKEMATPEVCCGFGGTFCVKYPEISRKIVDDKIDNIQRTGATVLAGGDLGCLMNIGGRLKRRDVDVKVYHIAEILTGMAVEPLGEEQT